MKIVILDGYTENPGDLSWNRLAGMGELTVYDRTPAGEIAARIGDAEAVYTNKTPISRETLDACPSVRFIGVLATGYNVVDVAAARERGIPVCNIPTYGTAAVAQYTFALLLELCHHVGHHGRTVAEGRWQNSPDWCYWDYPLVELAGKAMGIIGYGRIGRAVGQIALAMGMELLVSDVSRNPALENGRVRYAGLDEIYAGADVISLHCPLFAENTGMISADSIAKMRDGVMLINTSRGPLIVEEDLRDALVSGKVAGAAVDVLGEEPPRSGSPLIGAPNCIVTPHIAWAPRASRARLMRIAEDNLAAFWPGSPVNVVNP